MGSRPPPPGPLPPGILAAHSYADVRKALELEQLRALWTKHRGDLSAIAAELNASVRTVYRRFASLGLKPGHFRQNPCAPGAPG